MAQNQLITLLTDFGLVDSYAAEMKFALLRHCPTARLIDITHVIPPQDIAAASIVLERAIRAADAGTIHLVVVDPGVGTDRRLLIARIREQWIICPDNGVITWPWRRMHGRTAMELTWRPKSFAATFAGRDIMARVAGMLAEGANPAELARPIKNPLLLDLHPARKGASRGRIIHIDGFGNATTNFTAENLPSQPKVRVNRRDLGKIRHTYGDVDPGQPLALIGSSGLLEIAVRNGSAQSLLSLSVGDIVTVD